MSRTMLSTNGSICRAVGRSRLTSFRFDFAEAPKARLGVSFIFVSPPIPGARKAPFNLILSHSARYRCRYRYRDVSRTHATGNVVHSCRLPGGPGNPLPNYAEPDPDRRPTMSFAGHFCLCVLPADERLQGIELR